MRRKVKGGAVVKMMEFLVLLVPHSWPVFYPLYYLIQAPQLSWSGLPFPSPGDLPDPGIKPWSPVLQADALTSEPPGKPILPNILQICGECMLIIVCHSGFWVVTWQ